MEVDIELTQEDWQYYNTFFIVNLQKSKSKLSPFFSNLIFFFVVGFTLAMIFGENFHLPSAAASAAVFGGIYLHSYINNKRLQKAILPNEKGIFIGKHKYIVENNGVRCFGNGYSSFYEKSSFKRIYNDDNYMMIFIDTVNALIFPKRNIDNIELFQATINDYYS